MIYLTISAGIFVISLLIFFIFTIVYGEKIYEDESIRDIGDFISFILLERIVCPIFFMFLGSLAFPITIFLIGPIWKGWGKEYKIKISKKEEST